MPVPAELASMLDVATTLQHNVVERSCISCAELRPHVASLLQSSAWPLLSLQGPDSGALC